MAGDPIRAAESVGRGAISSMDDFRRQLDHAAHSGPAQLASLARWLSKQPDEAAFLSVRRLAKASGANPNTVIRLAASLGFDGYGALQHSVRALLKPENGVYSQRAAALKSLNAEQLAHDLRESTFANVEGLYTAAVQAQIAETVTRLRGARHVHCIGVRSCYSVAHFLSYSGGMVMDNFVPTPAQPGILTDTLANCTPDDIVIAISYAHYSSEVIRACQIARDCGARIVAMTDSYASPIARGAWQVFRLRMEGPQLLPSLLPAFHLCEILLAELTASDSGAENRIQEFERRMLRIGGYLPAEPR